MNIFVRNDAEMIEIQGKKKTRHQLAEDLGISYTTLMRIIKKGKLSIPKRELLSVAQQEQIILLVEG